MRPNIEGREQANFDPADLIAIPAIGEAREASVTLLKTKRDEYVGRRDPYKAPEQQPELYYRLAIIDELLANNEISRQEIKSALEAKYGKVDQALFENSFGVIKLYAEGGKKDSKNT